MPDQNKEQKAAVIEPEVLEENAEIKKVLVSHDIPDVDEKLKQFHERNRLENPPATKTEDGFLRVLESAINRNYDVKLIEKMMELRNKEDERVQKREFFQAFARFKKEDVKVMTDRINDLFDSGYSSLGNFLNTVNPFLGRHGLSANFITKDIEDGKKISCTCILYHFEGHTLEATLSASPDTKGPQGGAVKTEIHGTLSSLTHLMRATFSAVTGIAAIDSRFDDDGNLGAGARAVYISEDQVKELNALMDETKINKTVFLKSLKVDDIKKLPFQRYKQALSTLEAKKKKGK